MFQRLVQNGLRLNGKKCQLFQKQVAHLGHIVSLAGVAVDPSKVDRIQTWPIRETNEQLRSFLGLASYYRRYVPNFAKIAAPLRALVGKTPTKAGKPHQSRPLIWSDEATSAFEALKSRLAEAPVLVYPNVTGVLKFPCFLYYSPFMYRLSLCVLLNSYTVLNYQCTVHLVSSHE